tara:strand:- start:266 stop:1168 length:903 start_codon:yes stop_codon:yes gene_type:complete
MGVRSLGNALAGFGYKFGRTGTEASGAGAAGGGNISATGGNQTSSSGFTAPNGFKYHVFTSSGSLVVASGSGEAYYLVVAGGGSGGYGNGAGGGAGGLRSNDPTVPGPSSMKVSHTFTLSPGTYPVTVGDGGTSPADNGSESKIGTSTVVASGGGYGGNNSTGNPGGSGGGGTSGDASSVNSPDPLSPDKQGNAGGNDGNGGGGGGGGGSASGATGGAKLNIPAYNTTQINPGITMPAAWQSYVGTAGGYAGGGYGHDDNPNSHNQGAGSTDQGIVNTGGGGDEGPGIDGGKGIVIIRYQ